MKTVTSRELKKLIRASGAGGFFGRGIRLFDEQYAIFTVSEMDTIVTCAMGKLASEGIVPEEDYAENAGDCDTLATIIWAEILKGWMKKHKGQKSYPAIAFGFGIMPDHAVNVGVCKEGVKIWNYGTLTDWNPKDLIEVDVR